MKVDTKHIAPFLESIKNLLNDFHNGMNEYEDKDGLEDGFIFLNEQISTIISTFKVSYMLPVNKEIAKKDRPYFVRATDKILTMKRYKIETPALTDADDRMIFMTKLYIMVKKKLEYDSVGHLNKEDKMQHHIITYLIANDDEWVHYFRTELADCMYKVVDTIVSEIMEERRKNPQLVMTLETPAEEPVKSRKLIDLLN